MFLDMIIKCFNKGYFQIVNEQMLLVNINFICVIILTKFFRKV